MYICSEYPVFKELTETIDKMVKEAGQITGTHQIFLTVLNII